MLNNIFQLGYVKIGRVPTALSGQLKSLSLTLGAVFLGPFEGVDHEKFIVIAGMDDKRVYACTVLINSNINPFIMKRQHMLDCQVLLKSEQYSFLSHDSFVNCAQPISANLQHFMDDEYKYCGLLNKDDLENVIESIKRSGVLSEDELRIYFNLR